VNEPEARLTANPQMVSQHTAATSTPAVAPVQDDTPIRDARPRIRGRFTGDVRRIRIQPQASVGTLELKLTDGTGYLIALFMGRRSIPGVDCGSRLTIEGTPVAQERGLVLYNPAYELR
jgi:hypothetical protein